MKDYIEKDVQLLCPQCSSKELTKDDNNQVTCHKCKYQCSFEELEEANKDRMEKMAIKLGDIIIEESFKDLLK